MRWNRPLIRPEGGSHPLETGLDIFKVDQDLESNDLYTYYVLLIDLFDRAILQNDLHTLSDVQQKLLELYFAQAEKPTDEFIEATSEGEIEEFEYDFGHMDRHIRTLDDFLGSYLGEDSGRYARYGNKQFHSQRKPFSLKVEPLNRA